MKTEPSEKAAKEVSTQKQQRLMSLDALRGFDMLWIVGGATIALALGQMGDNPITGFLATQMTHSTWEGFTFYDLIFPLFLFIVGVSCVLSIDKALETKGTRAVLANALRRSVMLFAFGVFYMGGLSQRWPEIALGGVLHRIAACYFVAVLTYVFVRSAVGIFIVSVSLLVGYWALMTFVPIPNLKLDNATVAEVSQKIGSDNPKDIAASIDSRIRGSYEEGLNLANYVDFLFLPGRKYGPGIKTGAYYISEGLLSTMPAAALSLFGLLAGILLKATAVTPNQKCLRLLYAGVACIVMGSVWSLQFPFIKRIWTSSFILLTGGISFILMSVFYWVIDVKQWQRWCRPFVWVGSNALTIYLLYSVVDFKAIAERIVGGDISYFLDSQVGMGSGALCIAIVRLLLGVLLMRFMYNQKIFLRL